MRITMLKTIEGSPDGLRVLVYRKGETYNVPDELGQIFLRERWAARAPLGPTLPPVGAEVWAGLKPAPTIGRGDSQGKDAGAAPENKMAQKVKTVSSGKRKHP